MFMATQENLALKEQEKEELQQRQIKQSHNAAQTQQSSDLQN